MKMLTLSEQLPFNACVATIGFFDGVHKGHRFLIHQVAQEAKARGVPSLLVTFRNHPRKALHAAYQPQLLTTFEEKCRWLSTTEADYCIALDFTPQLSSLSARQFMAEILHDKLSVTGLVIGYDHRFGHDRSEGFPQYVDYGHELNMEIIQANAFSMGGMQVSSSMVRACLLEGEVEMASRCLARPYELAGTVVHGFHVGQELGFPTANLQIEDPQKLVPKNGVYAVWVKGSVDGKACVWGGMLNIGFRPTLDNGDNQTIEVHLLDFTGDLYNNRLSLEFIGRLRDEKKFRNKGELARQLREDEEKVRMILSKSTERRTL